MIVIFLSQSQKRANKTTRRILDSFAQRVGDNCWKTIITKEGLRAVRNLLAKSATKNTAVSCHWIRSKNRSELLWIVGNRDRFNSEGIVPVHRTKQDILQRYRENDWIYLKLIQSLTAISALFHDFGKASDCFQKKLKFSSIRSDALRHEWVSIALFGSFVSIEPDSWKLRLINSHFEKEQFLANLSSFKLEDFVNYPIDAQLIAWLILSHHKMPLTSENMQGFELPNFEDFFETVSQDWGYSNQKEDKRACLHFSKALVSDSVHWQRKVLRWANRLDSLKVDFEELFSSNAIRAILHHCKLALVLADHNYSSQKADSSWHTNIELYANTDRKTKKMKQYLDEHLCGVCDIAVNLIYNFPLLQNELPSSTKIQKLRKPSPKYFSWQDRAVKKISQFYKTDNIKSGFFAVNMASTGMGKTIANAKIMNAISSKKSSLRYTLLLGLRTLTLQTGDEYKNRLGFEDDDLAVVIGSKRYIELHNIKEESEKIYEETGSLSSKPLSEDEVIFDMVADESLLDTILKTQKDKKLLYAPVLVSTIDYMMASINHSKGGKWILSSLRLISSDIVIDEIDDFTSSDLIAIGRLIHLAGMLGRKVMISSATIAPDIAYGYFHAYYMGWQIYAKAHNAKMSVDSFWCDEFKSSYKLIAIDENCDSKYQDYHKKFVEYRVKKLQSIYPKRRGLIANLDISSNENKKEIYFKEILNQIKNMHKAHHIIDKESAKRVSFGVVRFANINPCVDFGVFLSKTEIKDIDIKITIYHSQQILLMRHEQERYLDSLLKRKSSEQNILQDTIVKRHIENSESEDITFVVIATPVEEVGRDHDFDWAVVEPSSYRSIVQLAGRVRRHREGEVKSPNIAIMRYNLKAFKDGDIKGKRYFYNPGYEIDTTLKNHDLKYILDEKDISDRIDAVPRVLKATKVNEKDRLIDLEHFEMAKWLTNYNQKSASTLEGYLKGYWYLTAMPITYNKFRKSSPTLSCYRVYDEDSNSYYFAQKDIEGNFINREDILNIKTIDLSNMSIFWLDRGYKNILDRYSELIGDSMVDISKKFGELSYQIYSIDDIYQKQYLYNEQLGLFEQKEEGNL